VEHEAAIKHARAEISKRWKSEGFREASRAVNQKLGSRNKQPIRTRTPKKKPSTQLNFDL
jgi:hypothetical protein